MASEVSPQGLSLGFWCAYILEKQDISPRIVGSIVGVRKKNNNLSTLTDELVVNILCYLSGHDLARVDYTALRFGLTPPRGVCIRA